MPDSLTIGGHTIGPGYPTFIIAEIGVNHNGEVNLAIKMIQEAARCGADCVKFQTFKAERVVLKNAPKAAYQLKNTPSPFQSKQARCRHRGIRRFSKLVVQEPRDHSCSDRDVRGRRRRFSPACLEIVKIVHNIIAYNICICYYLANLEWMVRHE